MTNKDFSFDAQCRRGNRLMMIVGMGLFVTSLALAGWYGTWMEALLIGGSAIAMPALLTRMAPLALATRIAHGLGFMIFAALLIHQTHGLLEMHFSIFALLAFLLYYRDPMPILAAAGLIAVHHLGFNYLQAGRPLCRSG